MLTEEQIKLLNAVSVEAASQGLSLYLVGGIVRDIFLGHSLHDKDIDIIVDGSAIPFAKVLGRKLGAKVTEYTDFLTAKLSDLHDFRPEIEVDLASVRIETYDYPGALPRVTQAMSIMEDLKRRDFSVNAMALPLNVIIEWAKSHDPKPSQLEAPLIDLFSGLNDLRLGKVRVLHPQSFIDDPTRIFRAARYVARLPGSLEDDTQKLMQEAIRLGALDTVSAYRKLNELRKIIEEDDGFKSLQILGSMGVFQKFEIFNLENQDNFTRGAERLCALRLKDDDLRYEALLGVCFATFNPERGRERMKNFGLSKKKISRISSEVEVARASAHQSSDDLSDLALVLMYAIRDTDDLIKELRRKISSRHL